MLKSPDSAIEPKDDRIEHVQMDVIQTLVLISNCNQQLVWLCKWSSSTFTLNSVLSGYASGAVVQLLDILIGQSMDVWIIKMSSGHAGTPEKNFL